MTIISDQKEATVRITVDGNIDSAAGHDFSIKLMEIMEIEEVDKVEFDLTTVKTITSSAIGKLINFFKYMEQKSGLMEIVAISDTLLRQFSEIHLDRIIPIRR